MRQAPRAVRTARRLCGEILIDPKLPELRVSRCATSPLLPDHGTQTMPYPLIQSFQQRGSLTETEVTLPAPEVGRQFFQHLFQTDSSRPSRQFPNFLLAAQQGLRRDAPFRFF